MLVLKGGLKTNGFRCCVDLCYCHLLVLLTAWVWRGNHNFITWFPASYWIDINCRFANLGCFGESRPDIFWLNSIKLKASSDCQHFISRGWRINYKFSIFFLSVENYIYLILIRFFRRSCDYFPLINPNIFCLESWFLFFGIKSQNSIDFDIIENWWINIEHQFPFIGNRYIISLTW